MSDNNTFSKIVDIKPRDKKSSLTGFFPNDELLESTARIKAQRDLIQDRLKKMTDAKSRVSQAVYDKVSRDYSLQLETVNSILGEKKSQLKDEIKKLYLNREKLSFEISRHKEVLEEAEFRYYLEEFTQVQYQEVENFETKEIEKLESDLAHITQWVRRHEDLFDPEDFGRAPVSAQPLPPAAPPASHTEPALQSHVLQTPEITKTALLKSTPEESTRTILAPSLPEPLDPAQNQPVPSAPDVPDEFSHLFTDNNTSQPEANPHLKNTHDNIESLLQNEDLNLPDPSAGDYYREEQVGEQSFEMAPSQPAATDNEDSVTVSKTASGLHDHATKPNPSSKLDASLTQLDQPHVELSTPSTTEEDSISEILDSIRLGDEESEDVSIRLKPTEKTGQAQYKLSVLQGPLDAREFDVKDNTSIGRSAANDVVIQEPKISRQHAAINKYNDNYILIDLKSSNGVYVNGVKIDEVILNPGDEISIGSAKFLFETI